MSTPRMFRGAVIGKKATPTRPAPPTKEPVSDGHNDAYLLARANQNKSWARRWLRANGYSL